jgi:putative transposase
MLIRKKNRLTVYDYSSAGYYFITISTVNGISILGKFKNKSVELSEIGIIVKKYLEMIPEAFNRVSLDEYIIMPDHLHILIEIRYVYNVVGAEPAPTKYIAPSNTKTIDRSKMLLCNIIQQFKRACTLEIRSKNLFNGKIWQRSFYDRIIRNSSELEIIRQYIKNNPVKWQKRGTV